MLLHSIEMASYVITCHQPDRSHNYSYPITGKTNPNKQTNKVNMCTSYVSSSVLMNGNVIALVVINNKIYFFLNYYHIMHLNSICL